MFEKEGNAIWQIWIDTGGTFTDCIARAPDGKLHRTKVLSSGCLRGIIEKPLDEKKFRINHKWHIPSDFIRGFMFTILGTTDSESEVEHFDANSNCLVLKEPWTGEVNSGMAFEVKTDEEAPILAARMVTRTMPDRALPELNMRLATTRGTNALLERKGVPLALFVTRGFADLLRIGTQQRPNLFALNIVKPEPLYQIVVEVDERISDQGQILRKLDTSELHGCIEELLAQGLRVAAVSLLHSYVNPDHEHELTEYLKRNGFHHVSSSAELAPFIKILERTETAVVDAYITPIICRYINNVQSAISRGRLHVLTSAGGLINAHEFNAKDSLLSGPAGGVVGAALTGRQSGFNKIIAFDMGGTSTDVARYDGDYEYVFEHQVGDAHLVAPALAIESVAAGGGSICSFDGYRLQVGPESAGAQPGPACYGAGGPLTLTDVNLLLGRLNPDYFEIPMVKTQALSRLSEIIQTVTCSTGEKIPSDALLQGFLDIADERMADAIRRVSVRKGFEPGDYALISFGGAGGQHACSIAEKLGMAVIIIPKEASLLSALGLGHAVLERFAEKQILKPLNQVEHKIRSWLKALAETARRSVAAEGIPESRIAIRRQIVNVRFVGQDSIVAIEYCGDISLHKIFQKKYQQIFGHLPEGRQLEVESLRVICSDTPVFRKAKKLKGDIQKTNPMRHAEIFIGGQKRNVPCYERDELSPGMKLRGPALIFERHSTTVLEMGWHARIDENEALVLNKT